jgi:hypothetical protein
VRLVVLTLIVASAIATSARAEMPCMTPDMLMRTIPAKYTFSNIIEGAELAKLDKIAPGAVPQPHDQLFIFAGTAPDATLHVETRAMQIFYRGCLVARGIVTKRLLDAVASDAPYEDGSI